MIPKRKCMKMKFYQISPSALIRDKSLVSLVSAVLLLLALCVCVCHSVCV